ncbi:MAG: peroxide stress protein YaaA [Flammeovirgaceae bacterium]
MLVVISPAKTLDFESKPVIQDYSLPLFLDDSEKVIKKLRSLSKKKVKELMNISDKLVDLNKARYAQWDRQFDPENAKQAVLAFKGDVYVGLDAETFSEEDFEFAQNHLRILSGLHGVLKPLDLIRPYRLEMGTKLPVGRRKDLYHFWDKKVTEVLNDNFEETTSKVLVNLASNEYFKVIQPKYLKGEVITPVFKDLKGDQYKVVSFFAKKARGMMAAFIIKNKIEEVEHIKAFDTEGYAYNADLSNGNEWVFTRG